MSEVINREEKTAIENLSIAKPINRIAAAIIDFAFFFALAFLLQLGSSFIFARQDMPYGKAYSLQYNHMASSTLTINDSVRGYISLEENNYFQREDDNFLIINRLSYYYLSYLTGENIKEGYVYSLDFDKPIDNVARKDYYTIKWFNESILGLDASGSDSEFFTYQKNGEEVDYQKVGTLKEEYYTVTENNGEKTYKVEQNEKLYESAKKMYKDAYNNFQNQSFIKESTKTMNLINSFILLFSSLLSMIVFYLIIPMLSPFGKTLGKRFFNLTLVNDQGFLTNKLQLLLRTIPLVAAIAFISFINSLYISLIFGFVLVLASFSFMMFTKNKQAIHDFIARTIVIKTDDNKLFKNKEEYNDYLILIRKRDSEDGRKD